MAERFDNDGFKATAYALPEAIITTDPEGRITWANPAFKDLCGYTMREILGQRPGSLLQGAETDPDAVRSMHRAMEQQHPFQLEILNYHKKGHTYWAALSVTPFLDENGRLQGHIGVARDITTKQFEMHRMENDIVGIYKVLLAELSPNTATSEADPFLTIPTLSES